MANWTQGLSANPPQNNPVHRIVPGIATYGSAGQKSLWVGMQGLSEEEKAQYQAGATKSVAAKQFVDMGSIGLVTSCLDSAAQVSAGQNNWHTVGMARHQGTVFIHDPSYHAGAYAGTPRMADVHGTRMVQSLVGDWPAKITGAYYQGPPSGYNRDQLECMGRSAQWVEGTVNGTLPWPPNLDPTGGQWTWHTRN